RFDANAGWWIVGCALLVKRLAADAVREPLHHERPIGDRRQQEWRHASVVRHEVALGVATLRKESLVEIGDVEPLIAAEVQRTRGRIFLQPGNGADQIANA